MDGSGSLPMSSADTDSTTTSRFFFSATAFSSEARKPVTTMSPAAVSSVAVGSWAGVVSPVTAALSALRSSALPGSFWLPELDELCAGSGGLVETCA